MANGDAAGDKSADANKDDKAADKAADKAVDKSTDDKAADKSADKSAGDKAADKSSDKSFTQADLDRELKRQKAEWDKEQKKLSDKAKLSEDERKNAEIAELKRDKQMRDAKDDFVAALGKENANASELLWKAAKGDLEFDAKTGQPTNMKDLIDGLKADYPDSFGIKKPDGDADGGKGQTSTGGLTKVQLETMSQAEIAKLDWNDVKKALAE